MKKLKALILGSLLYLGFWIASTASAQIMEVYPETEKVLNFEARIEMDTDVFHVRETIQYDFGQNYRHGIYRTIPVIYQNFLIRRGFEVTNIEATQDNAAQQFSKDVNSEGYLYLKIGDPYETITGVHTYSISYTVLGAYNFFDTHDELYWNSTGNDWDVAINRAFTEVILPAPIAKQDIKYDCFQGFRGSQESCDSIKPVTTATGEVIGITFESMLGEMGEGQTFVVGIPKNILYFSPMAKILLLLKANTPIIFTLLLPLAALCVMLLKWRLKGRDPLGRSTIIPEYEPPQGLSPLQVGALRDFTIHNRDIAAEIIYLAEQGYLKITSLEDDKDFQLERGGKDESVLPLFQKKLLEMYFPKNETVTSLKKLKNSIKKEEFTDLFNKAYQSLIDKGYFKDSPFIIRSKYIGVGVLVGMIGFLTGLPYAVGLIAAGIIIAVIGHFMPTRTKEGVIAFQHILGLEMYIKVAEQKRIEFHNAPQKNPQHFEALLPYAIVLRLEREWAEYFKDVHIPKPEWYQGDQTAFNSGVLVSHLSSFSSSASAVMASTQASSGGSGFGGGGSSGGGGGGGGGGSW